MPQKQKSSRSLLECGGRGRSPPTPLLTARHPTRRPSPADSQTCPPPRRNPAFTLVELLAVIAIIAVLAGVAIPVANQSRKSAERSVCAVNIRNVHSLIMFYATENKGVLPMPSYDAADDSPANYTEFYNDWFWQRVILRYVYPDLPLSPAPSSYILHRLRGGTCPAFARLARERDPAWQDILSYAMNQRLFLRHDGTVMNERLPTHLIATPSRTMLLTEARMTANGRPMHNMTTAHPPVMFEGSEHGGDYHDGAQHIVFCDGRVELFKNIKRIVEAPYRVNAPQDLWLPYPGAK